MKNKQDFINFLKTINLGNYRERFVGNKSVEEDLPKNIQILKHIYKYYWDDRKFLLFDEFIDLVINDINDDLKYYNKKRNNFSIHSDNAYSAFLDGWIARQYRTWASILTQIQFGYCAEEHFKNNKVLMTSELDNNGIDVRVEGYGDFGIKKISKRNDILKMKKEEKKGVIPITYWVPDAKTIKEPFKLNGEYRKPYLDFKQDTRLEILDNGFIIFNETVFYEITK
jgi:hypothetical protein